MSAPLTNGAFEVNSPNGPILPWLRSIDAFNTHDEALQLAIAGGVTTAQVLPGSGNAIGMIFSTTFASEVVHPCGTSQEVKHS